MSVNFSLFSDVQLRSCGQVAALAAAEAAELTATMMKLLLHLRAAPSTLCPMLALNSRLLTVHACLCLNMSLFSHDDVFWTIACNKAFKQSSETLLVSAHGSCGVTVIRADAAASSHLFFACFSCF
jgi:hypothetical protein